jgi:cellulose synthase/poly-beta-1,6-N-acetylglucosamine synthase-like glycosyltransferase
MLSTVSDPIAGVLLFGSVLLSIAFFVYGLNTLHLTIRSKRYNGVLSLPVFCRPPVAIHLPIYNELYVVGRLISSCVGVARQYGLDKVRIYVIDDSNDETRAEIDRIVTAYSAQGVQFRVIRRGSREGFKAGALQSALSVTEEKYVAIFDADLSPPPNFLDRTVSILEHDPAVGLVQARWAHLDRNHNLITRSLAIGVDAHFFLERKYP